MKLKETKADNLFKRLVEAFVPTNCHTDSKEFTDKMEKEKDSKEEKPVRDIIIKRKCDLVKTNGTKPNGSNHNNSHRRKVDKGGGNDFVSMDKDKFNYMMNDKGDEGDSSKSVRVRRDAVLSLLKEDGEFLDEIIRLVVHQINQNQLTQETMTDREKDLKQKDYNKKVTADRKHEREFYPLKHINRDFMKIASGIYETSKEDGKKKNCSSGSPLHGSDGKFSSKEDAKVWSLKWAKGGSDCKSGVTRYDNGSEKFTKLPCGGKFRGKKGSIGKEKLRCKDSKPAWE